VRLRSANAMTDAMLPRASHTLDQFTHSLDSPAMGNCERGGHECGWSIVGLLLLDLSGPTVGCWVGRDHRRLTRAWST
jgi:hypothetical protein